MCKLCLQNNREHFQDMARMVITMFLQLLRQSVAVILLFLPL